MDASEIARLIDNMNSSDEDVGMDAFDRLTALGAPAVEPLLAVVADRSHACPSIQDGAVLVLGNIGDPRAVEPLLALYRDLAAREWPSGWSSRSTLVTALARIGDPRARELLEEVAASDPIDSIRDDAVAGLKKLRPAT